MPRSPQISAPSGPAWHLPLSLGIALVSLNLLVLGMAWASVRQGRRHAEEQAALNSGNLARVIAQNLEADIRAIDLGLIALTREIAREQATGGIKSARRNAFIEDLFKHYPTLDSIRTANAAGEIDHGIGVPPGPRATIADRDYFRILKGNPSAGLVISAPALGRISKKWVIMLARRIDDPQGCFSGVVYGVITVDTFCQLLSHVDPGSQGSVVLRDGNLGLMARYPYVKGVSDKVGDRNLNPVFLALLKAGQTSGTYKAHAAIDSVERTYSFRKVGPHPLLVNVGLASQDYLTQWQRETRNTWIVSVLFGLLTASLGTLLLRAWNRERTQRQQQLSEALDEVKALSGLLPICSNCKKIRDDTGYWNKIEAYIQERSEAQFTHGMCPDCARILFPGFFEKSKPPGDESKPS